MFSMIALQGKDGCLVDLQLCYACVLKLLIQIYTYTRRLQYMRLYRWFVLMSSALVAIYIGQADKKDETYTI